MFNQIKSRLAIRQAKKKVNALKSKVNRPAMAYSEALADLANAEETYAHYSGKLGFNLKAAEHYKDAAENIRYDKRDPDAHAYYRTYTDLAGNATRNYEKGVEWSRKHKEGKLEKQAASSSTSTGTGTLAAIIVASFVGALILLSPNLTGQTIGELSKGNCNFVGVCLFLAGIAGAALLFNKKNKLYNIIS